MAQYILFLKGIPESGRLDGGPLSAEEVQRYVAPYRAWLEKLRSEGRLVRADRLRDDRGARLTTRSGKVVPLDAPFTESKEVIGGFYIVEATDLDEAQRIAAECPHLMNGGDVEIRAIAE